MKTWFYPSRGFRHPGSHRTVGIPISESSRVLQSSIGSGVGILLKGSDEFKVCYAQHFGFPASNNMNEYEALLNGMQIALEVEATNLRINSDSYLVVNQIKGVYQAKDLVMEKYLAKVRALETELSKQEIIVEYRQIPREENEEAELLSKLSAEELKQLPQEVYIQQIDILTFEKPALIMQVDEEQSWMIPYLEYLEAKKLPEDKVKTHKIVAKAANYQAVRGIVYQRGKFSL